LPAGIDGPEHVKGGDFIVSVWSGAVLQADRQLTAKALDSGGQQRTHRNTNH